MGPNKRNEVATTTTINTTTTTTTTTSTSGRRIFFLLHLVDVELLGKLDIKKYVKHGIQFLVSIAKYYGLGFFFASRGFFLAS